MEDDDVFASESKQGLGPGQGQGQGLGQGQRGVGVGEKRGAHVMMMGGRETSFRGRAGDPPYPPYRYMAHPNTDKGDSLARPINMTLLLI